MTKRAKQQVAAIRDALAANPGLENERIRIAGVGGFAAMLQERGWRMSPRVIRRPLRRMKIATSGRGRIAGALVSREQLDRKILELATGRTEWKDGVTVRGSGGLKSLLAAHGIRVNHEVIRRRLQRLKIKARARTA